jgi:hypothetical protein
LAPAYGWVDWAGSWMRWPDLRENRRRLMVEVVANLRAEKVITDEILIVNSTDVSPPKALEVGSESRPTRKRFKGIGL